MIVSVKEVISASVALLISPSSRFAGKAKVAQVKNVALQSIDTFMFATITPNTKTVKGVMELR